jgi:hypothetical protein
MIHSCLPENGGYRVVFEGCGHSVWLAGHPGTAVRCSACLDDAVENIRKNEEAHPWASAARETLVRYAPRLAAVQKDAQAMSAATFTRKHGISPQEFQHRVRRLKELAAGCVDDSSEGEVHELVGMITAVLQRERR